MFAGGSASLRPPGHGYSDGSRQARSRAGAVASKWSSERAVLTKRRSPGITLIPFRLPT